MKRSTHNGTNPAHEPSDPPKFKVVIFYEDRAAGIRAKYFYDNLVYGLEGKYDLNLELWSFQVLSIPEIGHSAAQVAAQADVVLLSLHGNAGLPPKIREWIERWSRLIADNNAALVLLADRSQTSDGCAVASEVMPSGRAVLNVYFFFVKQLKPWSSYYRRSGLSE